MCATALPAGRFVYGHNFLKPFEFTTMWASAQGRAVHLHSFKTRVQSAYGVCKLQSALKLSCDELLSNAAFKFKLRPCSEATARAGARRCRP
jgi:hypothetical protein